MRSELLERLIADDPELHAWGDGTRANWSVDAAVLRWLAEVVAPGMITLETGAGQTTVAFAILGARHICITPDREEAARVRHYCASLGVPADLTFWFGSSDRVLPTHPLPSALDLVFVDGAHRFPFACLDWHYTQDRIKVGGLLGLDDVAMPSVRILHDFLLGEDEWDLVATIARTSFFRRLRETCIVDDCHGQRLNQR